MTYKPWGPGSPTGGETTDGGAPGNKDYYPSRESDGYSTGGEGGASSSPGSSVPPKTNPNAGGTGIDQSLINTGTYDYTQNPTGSSLTDEDASNEDDGSYGSRPASSPGTNAD
jgi:hypothetical protein